MRHEYGVGQLACSRYAVVEVRGDNVICIYSWVQSIAGPEMNPLAVHPRCDNVLLRYIFRARHEVMTDECEQWWND
jgi:hypothetical protein